MTDPMLNSAKKMIDSAEALRAAADVMAQRRMVALLAKEIDEDEFRNNAVRETFLRSQVSEIVVRSIKHAIEGLEGEQAELESAIDKAKQTIKKIAEIRKALRVFATLIGLAEAIVLGKPQGILDAFKTVKEEAGSGPARRQRRASPAREATT